jgi:hypothetical protein
MPGTQKYIWSWPCSCCVKYFVPRCPVQSQFSVISQVLPSSVAPLVSEHLFASKRAFVRALQQLVPEVNSSDLVLAPARVRAQALERNGSLVADFRFECCRNLLHVCNVPSPTFHRPLPLQSSDEQSTTWPTNSLVLAASGTDRRCLASGRQACRLDFRMCNVDASITDQGAIDVGNSHRALDR